MSQITDSVVKKDHAEKVRGSALYVSDYPRAGLLLAKLVRSPFAHARILNITYPKLPAGYIAADSSDIRGVNSVHIVEDDCPVFVDTEAFYIGDPVAIIAGPDLDEVRRLAEATVVEYEELPAVISLEGSTEAFFAYHYGRGDIEAAFAAADRVFSEDFSTGYQEQAYLETQGISVVFANGLLTAHGSMQCPFYVRDALARVTGLAPEQVRVIQDCTGGGFGGKEAFPSILASEVAVAAMKAPGQEIRAVFDRREDMEFTSKRHPSQSRYRAAVKDGRVTALDINVRFNSGAYTTLTPVVLQRAIIAAPGVYNVANLQVSGQAMRTHTVPAGAFRGFGAPQAFFAVERFFDHIAAALGVEPLDFKLAQLSQQGDPTSTGGVYHFDVPLPQLAARVQEMSGYRPKRAAFAAPPSGRYRRGIGLALWYHGAGFTGSAERDLIKAVVRLHKLPSGEVQILVANTEIGQGLKTGFAKIVAHELGISYDAVLIANPDTLAVANSGPTVASRSLMTVGELLRRAAANLKANWQDGQDQVVEEHFSEPAFQLPFDIQAFQGDAYPTYSWAAVAVELQIDSLTGSQTTVGCWGCFDVGTPIDLSTVIGQIEGGIVQGLGYASMEQMAVDSCGRIRNNSFSDYIIPTAVDVPDIQVQLCPVAYPGGPYGAKGAGELPLVGMAAAYAAAAEQALGGALINHIPFTVEDSLACLLAQTGEK